MLASAAHVVGWSASGACSGAHSSRTNSRRHGRSCPIIKLIADIQFDLRARSLVCIEQLYLSQRALSALSQLLHLVSVFDDDLGDLVEIVADQVDHVVIAADLAHALLGVEGACLLQLVVVAARLLPGRAPAGAGIFLNDGVVVASAAVLSTRVALKILHRQHLVASRHRSNRGSLLGLN